MFEHKIMRNQELMANWQRSLKKAIETNRYDSRYNVIDVRSAAAHHATT